MGSGWELRQWHPELCMATCLLWTRRPPLEGSTETDCGTTGTARAWDGRVGVRGNHPPPHPHPTAAAPASFPFIFRKIWFWHLTMLYLYVRWKTAKRKQRCQTNGKTHSTMSKPMKTGTKAGALGQHDGLLGVKLPTAVSHSCPEAELQVGTKHHSLPQQKASFHLLY